MEVLRGSESLKNPERIITAVKSFQAGIRDSVRNQLLEETSEELSRVVAEGAGDVSYKVDARAEDAIESFAQGLSQDTPLIVTAEGIGRKEFTQGRKPEIEVLIDPIDGTRGIMYDFRSAWVLTGIAPYKEEGANLSDIEIAVQTEIPTSKQDKVSVLWAVKGQGAFEEIWDLRENKLIFQRRLQPSQAKELKHGFASFVDFFPGSKVEIGRLAERVYEQVIGPVEEGKALVFDDQYICNAGQMYLLASGKYRFLADLRPEMEKILNKKGKKLGLASHPYDLSTALIAQEGGVVITDAKGEPLSYPFDTKTNCSWIGYANKDIQRQVEPVLIKELAALQ